MTFARIPNPLNGDWEETFDSIKSTPGAFGNILVAASRQIKPVDIAAFALVFAGWVWLIAGFGISDNHNTALVMLAVLPTLLWLAAGSAGGLIFEIGGIGPRSMVYWESYLLILLFALFGTISLRIAVNPRDRQVYRGTALTTDPANVVTEP